MPRWGWQPSIQVVLASVNSELIGNPKPNPQRVPHIQSQDGDPPSHEQSTRVANCDLPRGRLKNPSQITWWGSKQSPITSSTPPLLQAVYGVGKHPRVTRNPQQTQESSATKRNSQSNALESHSISLGLAIKQGDEWRECSLAQSMPQVFKSAS